MNDENSNDIPKVIDSGSKGDQSSRTVDGEVLAPITETSYSDGNFLAALEGYAASRERGISGFGMSQLVIGRMQDLEAELRSERQKKEGIQAALDQEKVKHGECRTELRVAETTARGRETVRKLSTAVLVLASIVLMVALVPELSDLGMQHYVLLAVAALLYVVGIFGPWFFSNKDKD